MKPRADKQRTFMGCYFCPAEVETTGVEGHAMPEGWGFAMGSVGPIQHDGTRLMDPCYACPNCKDDDDA